MFLARRGAARALRAFHTRAELVTPCQARSLDQRRESSHTRDFSKVTDNRATELYFEEIFEQGFAGGDPLFDLRNYFYPESEDPDIEKLSNASCVADVLEMTMEVEHLNHRHLTQCVATIHHLQKLSQTLSRANHDDEYRNVVVQFNKQLRSHPRYQQLMDLILTKVDEFPHNELAFILMGLRKFQEPLCSLVLRDIFIRLQRNMAELDMETLSYLSVGLRPRFYQLDNYRLVWRMAMAQSLPRLQQHLLACNTPEQLKRLAICFSNMTSIISDRMMDQMKDKVTSMIDSGQLSELEHLSVLGKLVALVVNKSGWHEENGDYVLLLTQQFLGRTQFLRPVQVIMLARVLLNFHEPSSLYYEVFERLVDIISNRQFLGNIPMISCLSYVLRINNNAIPLKEVEALLQDIINGPHLTDHISEVYDILRAVGFIRTSLVDQFFEKSFEALKDQPYELMRFAARYMNFFSPYTGQYRNRAFERRVEDYVLASLHMTSASPDRKLNWRDIEENRLGVHPNEFAQKLGMLLCFGHDLDAAVIRRLEDFLPNIGPEGLLWLSRGIQQNRKTRRNSRRKGREESTTDLLSLKVARASQTFIQNAAQFKSKDKPVCSVNDATNLLKNFTARSDFMAESSYGTVVELMTKVLGSERMSTHVVREIAGAITVYRMNMTNPELMAGLVSFVLRRPDPKELHVLILLKILVASARSHYPLPTEFLEVAGHCLNRDIDSINGLHSLQIANALASYDCLSKELVRSLFSNEFMRKLDKEMEMCGTRTTGYPKVLRQTLMELNRAVVLRYPGYGVPWFHHNYCTEHAADLQKSAKSGTAEAVALRQEVYEELCSVMGGWRFVREDVTTKHFNNVDFEVAYNVRGEPLDLVSNPRMEAAARRVAVQVVPAAMYTEDTRAMMMRPRVAAQELELEGWQVVSPSPQAWNSLQRAGVGQKRSYLEALLRQGTEEERTEGSL